MAFHAKLQDAGIGMTEAEYLQAELTSATKHEYIHGQAYAMTGASNNHARITGNIFGEFRNHLKGKPCEAFMSDTKVKAGESYFYPDVLVDCSKPSGTDYGVHTPVLIVEVLSKSTKKLDLTTKLIKYINLPSLEEYVLLEQDSVSMQVLRKQNHWQPEYYFLGDSVTFKAIDLTLTVEEIYDRVDNEELREFRLTN